jgi:hypothetical protein
MTVIVAGKVQLGRVPYCITANLTGTTPRFAGKTLLPSGFKGSCTKALYTGPIPRGEHQEYMANLAGIVQQLENEHDRLTR